MFHVWSRSDSLHGNRELTVVIDGDPPFRHFAMRALRRLGRPVVGLRDAEDALAWLDANRAPALITLDASLPRMDGFSLCQKIREHPRSSAVPIVCVSSLTEVDDHVRALKAGADVFLAKPVRPDLYLDSVTRLLRLGRHEQPQERRM